MPTDPAVIAACLTAPTGSGAAARWHVRAGRRAHDRPHPEGRGGHQTELVVTTIPGIDAKGDGGLLGVAVSPSYLEDGLIYAYVTTATDNRVIRIAPGDVPKPILTGIPKGASNNGGGLAFTPDGVLYVGTGNAGSAHQGRQSRPRWPENCCGWTISASPPPGNPQVGLADLRQRLHPDHHDLPAADRARWQRWITAAQRTSCCPAKSTRNYATLQSGDAVWTWKAGDGGAAGCAASDATLANTSLVKQQLSGSPCPRPEPSPEARRVLLGNKYGRLLTVQPGAKGALWLTTSNKDGHGKPIAADDRVILLPNAGAAGGNGPD